MTLAEALGLVRKQKVGKRSWQIFLVCGIQPLHLIPMVEAHVLQRFPNDSVTVRTGLYGSLDATIGQAAESKADAAVMVVEWSDLDPRLGLRSSGGWALSVQSDILRTCREGFARLLHGLELLGARMPVALLPPSLSPELVGHTAAWQSSINELDLQKELATFLADAARIAAVSVGHPSFLARVSPEPSRADALMDLRAGFPYTLAHASAVANQAVKLLFPSSPKKGIITDLDETVWSGILGEVGPSGVSWGLAEHAQIHGLYQQMLGHLAEMGVLVGAASKNEPALVEEALRREDLLLPAKALFPVCANWGPKSASVAEILRIWNIDADSVVFVDDSPMELEEVRAAFPSVTCLQFFPKRPAKVVELLQELRLLFGKGVVHKEDALRAASIRANSAMRASADGSVGKAFLTGLQGCVTFDCRKDPSNKRVPELINKTNQFNLNGIRLSEGDWLKQLRDDDSVVVAVSYEDRFGSLGTIGTLVGRRGSKELLVTSWVLSCRAFSRRIEDHMLDHLFEHHGVELLRLEFRPTERNEPLRKHLESLGLDLSHDAGLMLSREQLRAKTKDLPHLVRLQTQ
jgi:FkbH-like protein